MSTETMILTDTEEPTGGWIPNWHEYWMQEKIIPKAEDLHLRQVSMKEYIEERRNLQRFEDLRETGTQLHLRCFSLWRKEDIFEYYIQDDRGIPAGEVLDKIELKRCVFFHKNKRSGYALSESGSTRSESEGETESEFQMSLDKSPRSTRRSFVGGLLQGIRSLRRKPQQPRTQEEGGGADSMGEYSFKGFGDNTNTDGQEHNICQEQIKYLQEQIERITEQNTALKSEIGNLREEKQMGIETIRIYQEGVEDYEDKCQRYKQSCGEAIEALNNNKERINEMEMELQVSKDIIHQITELNKTHIKDIREQKYQYEEVRKRLQEGGQEIVQLNKRLEEVHRDLDSEIACRSGRQANTHTYLLPDYRAEADTIKCHKFSNTEGVDQAHDPKEDDLEHDVSKNKYGNPNTNQTGEMAQVVREVLNFLTPAARDKIKIRLTAEKLTQENYRGLKHLNDYIEEIELNCPKDSMRVQMIKQTADKRILQLLNLDDENKLKKITWEELKKKLMEQVPELDPRRAAKRLTKKHMNIDDNIKAFAAGIIVEYKEICRAIGKEDLRPGLNRILATAMTGAMNWDSRQHYTDDLINDPERTIEDMATSCNRSYDYKKSLFEGTGSRNKNIITVPQVASSQPILMNTSQGTMNQGTIQYTPIQSYSVTPENNNSKTNDRSDKPFPRSTNGTGHPFGRDNNGTAPPNSGELRSGYRSGYNNNTRQEWGVTISDQRKEAFRQWQDWSCQQCRGKNRATWYICDSSGCNGRATTRQLPRDSWQCLQSCGQNNWRRDHYCHCCLRPNPDVNTEYLRNRPSEWKPQPRNVQRWFSRPPVLDP